MSVVIGRIIYFGFGYTTLNSYSFHFNHYLSRCWSYVGCQGGQQDISLDFGCFDAGTVAHEIGTYSMSSVQTQTTLCTFLSMAT